MTLSKVKSVQEREHFKNPHGEGDLIGHFYTMEDGTKLKANHKKLFPFPEGSEVGYEVTKETEKYGKEGKVMKPEAFENRKTGPNRKYDPEKEAYRQYLIIAQSSQAHAVELYKMGGISNPNSPEKALEEIKMMTETMVNQVVEIAAKKYQESKK